MGILIIDCLKKQEIKGMSALIEIDNIIKSGLPLVELGINNWALNGKNAIQLIEECAKTNTPIYGGDVYFIVNGSLENSYSNWYCEEKESESYDEFSSRSIFEAKKFVTNFKKNSSCNEPFFAFVL